MLNSQPVHIILFIYTMSFIRWNITRDETNIWHGAIFIDVSSNQDQSVYRIVLFYVDN